MGTRLQLHDILTRIMADVDKSYASGHVYFQPPSNIQMKYPCIVYERSTGNTQFADNNPYIFSIRYQITVIDRNPDSVIPLKIAQLPLCTMDRHFVSDNLHHDTFNIYF